MECKLGNQNKKNHRPDSVALSQVTTLTVAPKQQGTILVNPVDIPPKIPLLFFSKTSGFILL
jgi:hypothetical protein